MKKVANFTLGEEEVLGFDTGLNAQAFAQAKMAQFLTQQGCLVYPDGTLEPWKADGVEENPKGNMIIYGAGFPGECLMALLSDVKRRDPAFEAVRYWIKARLIMEKMGAAVSLFPGAAGAFIVLSPSKDFPTGTLLFAPERIVRRCLEASGDDEVKAAQQWIHPDLSDPESAVFSAASMLYTVFCGEPPFMQEEAEKDTNVKTDGRTVLETLRQDIREGVFMPPELAAPGLDKELCRLLNEALAVKKQKERQKIPLFVPPSLDALSACTARAASEKTSFWFSPLDGEETNKILREREQYQKTSNLQVKTRRFVVRNITLIAVCAAAFIAVILGVHSFIKTRAERPNTKGMSPVQVIESYYGAFGLMDHMFMEACVINKAGRNEISMVTNLYVITKVRGAYEANVFTSVSAQEWLDAGKPETELTIFGVTDLKLRVLGGSESSGELDFEAEYLLWVPAGFLADENEKPSTLDELYESRSSTPPPTALRNRDRLKLVFHKNAWRISELDRTGL